MSLNKVGIYQRFLEEEDSSYAACKVRLIRHLVVPIDVLPVDALYSNKGLLQQGPKKPWFPDTFVSHESSWFNTVARYCYDNKTIDYRLLIPLITRRIAQIELGSVALLGRV